MVVLSDRVRREPRIPNGDLGALRRPVRRATVLRAVLGLALVGVLLAALGVARSRDARPDPLLAPGTTGMIVLDLSASAGLNPEVGALLRRVAAANQRTGFIGFSDVAYELVPPGTPGRDLAPMARFFSPGEDGSTPPDPWSTAFSAGTRISAGIEAAHDALRRDGIERGSIVLASDLEGVAEDLVRIPALLTALRLEGIEFRILPLAARDEQKRYFERIAGADAFIDSASLLAGGAGRSGFRLAEEETPWRFLVLAGALALLLAVNERLCGRLGLSAPGSGSA
jgi:hypothetical protein